MNDGRRTERPAERTTAFEAQSWDEAERLALEAAEQTAEAREEVLAAVRLSNVAVVLAAIATVMAFLNLFFEVFS